MLNAFKEGDVIEQVLFRRVYSKGCKKVKIREEITGRYKVLELIEHKRLMKIKNLDTGEELVQDNDSDEFRISYILGILDKMEEEDAE